MIDLSKIPHLQERQALLAQLARRDAIQAEYDAEIGDLRKQRTAICREMGKELDIANAKLKAARDAHAEEVGQIRDKFAASLDAVDEKSNPIWAKYTERFDLFDEAFVGDLNADVWLIENEEPIARCALTGLPLRADDELLSDEDGCSRILKAALPLRDVA
jgi:hypothetical protein